MNFPKSCSGKKYAVFSSWWFIFSIHSCIWHSLKIKGLFYENKQRNNLLCPANCPYPNEKIASSGQLSWVLSGCFWEVGTTTQESCFELAVFILKHSSALGKDMQLINIRKNWERVVTQLSKYGLLPPAVREGTIFFMFAVSVLLFFFSVKMLTCIMQTKEHWKSYKQKSILTVMTKTYESMRRFKTLNI